MASPTAFAFVAEDHTCTSIVLSSVQDHSFTLEIKRVINNQRLAFCLCVKQNQTHIPRYTRLSLGNPLKSGSG